ncbi:DNA-binding response regulator [Bordetella sp. LUAb4]|uniref:response regulator transcription factor n=1 Tax=Bordetella sp. LUAb4 TaxID=2843195 RepID=UPI001E34D530|nr:DNA-binding response regulator [Bordetella sp. LUAb4]
MPNNCPSDPVRTSPASVLIVDDSADDRILLTNFLHRQGFRTYMAIDGADGFQKAKAIRPDMVLMDVAMPACDGLTACRRLKHDRATANIPLMFLSAAALPEERVSGLAAGAVDYITKPFDFDEVRLRLSIHLPGATAANVQETADELLETATGSDAVLFREARAILRTNLQHQPDMATLAGATRASTRRLTQAFRRCVGLTVQDYVREERLRAARRLVMETSLPIGTIATDIGYSGAANFSTAFKDRFGVTPSGLRQTVPAA